MSDIGISFMIIGKNNVFLLYNDGCELCKKVNTRFTMATIEKYTTIIELNTEQAKRNLEELLTKNAAN